MPIIFSRDIQTGPHTRTLGPARSRELLGAGFMHKPGIGADQTRRVPTYYSLVYVLAGKGSYTDSRGREQPIGAGDCFQRIPGHVHSNRIDPASDWWECFIDFGPQLSQALVAMGIVDPEQPVVHAGLRQEWVDEVTTILELLQKASDMALPDLLPRLLALREAFDDGRVAIAALAVGRFVGDGLVREFFDEAWRPLADGEGGLIEPASLGA